MAIEGCAGFSDDQAYRAMDFLLAALGEIASEIFYSVAHLLNLDVDIVFVDTTSTYWEMEVAAELAGVADEDGGDGRRSSTPTPIRLKGKTSRQAGPADETSTGPPGKTRTQAGLQTSACSGRQAWLRSLQAGRPTLTFNIQEVSICAPGPVGWMGTV